MVSALLLEMWSPSEPRAHRDLCLLISNRFRDSAISPDLAFLLICMRVVLELRNAQRRTNSAYAAPGRGVMNVCGQERELIGSHTFPRGSRMGPVGTLGCKPWRKDFGNWGGLCLESSAIRLWGSDGCPTAEGQGHGEVC